MHTNRILHPLQFGFRPGHITVTILRVTDDVIDDKSVTVIVFISSVILTILYFNKILQSGISCSVYFDQLIVLSFGLIFVNFLNELITVVRFQIQSMI